MRPFKTQNKAELESVYEELELDLPEGRYTRQDLIMTLEDLDITPETISSFNKKEEKESVDNTEYDGMAVVCMDRNNVEFRYGKFRFTKNNRYILMSKELADELISTTSGFHKASVQEVKAYYRK